MSVIHAELVLDPETTAKLAGLEYTHDTKPGIIRKKKGDEFVYFKPNDERVEDEKTLSRIKSLAIPPAWEKVWISTKPNGHLQATGRDVKGRKQYRYHARWREVRDETKYEKMISFAAALPAIRNKVDQDLNLPGISRDKILATVVRLMEKTLIRVGNEEYAKENQSYGLTTMRDKHVEVEGSKIYFNFKGKSGVKHEISIKDKKLAKIVQKSKDLVGYELFQYQDENGDIKDITSQDVNNYLKEITGENFTAKDFRTWNGTVLALEELKNKEPFESQAQAKKNIVQAVENVSQHLGNTKAVCRKCYIHPEVINSYLEGTLSESLTAKVEDYVSEALRELRPEEIEVIVFLKDREARKLVS